MDGSARPLSDLEVTREIQSQIIELAGHLNAGTYRFLKLLAEYDRRGGWGDGNRQSCAHWLNWKCGINLGAAREQVRTAHALEQLPKISAPMARGELSYSKVRAITRAACTATEDCFLMIALHGTAHHTEKLVKYYRRATEREELSREQLQHQNRSLTYGYDYDGSLRVKGCLPAAAGAMFVKALEAAEAQLDLEHVAAETHYHQPKFATRRADAVTLIAQSFLKGNTGSATELVVHVDERTLRERMAGRYELEDGAVRFSQPNGESLEAACPAPTDWTKLVAQSIPIDKNAAATRWTGESMDYSTAIKALMGMRKRRDVAAATSSGEPCP